MTDFEKIDKLWLRENMDDETKTNINFFLTWEKWQLPKETILQYIKDAYIETINIAINEIINEEE